MEYSVNLAPSLRTCNITDNSYPWLTFLIDGGGGGQNIMVYILTPPPPPPTNIQEWYFINGIQQQLSFITQNIYISQTILFVVDISFLWGGGGGGGQYIMV